MEIPRHWRLKAQRYRLEGSACSSCGQFIFPPRTVCTKCQGASQLARIAPEAFQNILCSTQLTGIEAYAGCQIPERNTGESNDYSTRIINHEKRRQTDYYMILFLADREHPKKRIKKCIGKFVR